MKISILTPTINGREDLLRRARFSVNWQTWMGSIEHVIVDGNGHSPAEAFQMALERAKGELVMPLADDDWLAPHAAETLAGLIAQGADFASGQTLIAGNGEPRIVGHALDASHMATYGFDIGGAHMWPKKLTDHLGGFDPQYPNAADYDLYWRIAESLPHVAFVLEVLYVYNDHDQTDGNVNSAAIEEQCDRIRAAHLA